MVVVTSDILYKMVGAYRNLTLHMYVGTGAVAADQNYISLPYHFNISSGATYNTMRGLKNDIGATSVNKWDQDNSVWISVKAFGADYPLEFGKCYMVVVTGSVDWECPVVEPT